MCYFVDMRENDAASSDFMLAMQRVMKILMSECSGRLHWGKAGWPRYNGCFDGAKAYPNTWCQFGCAVQVRMHISSMLLCCNHVYQAVLGC